MANNLEFKISAEDQASRVVETVQHKIQNFGKDVAKMALGFAGPMALVQMGFQKINDLMDESKKRREESIQSITNDPIFEQIKNQTKLNDSLSEGEKILLSQIALREQEAKLIEDNKAKRETYTQDYLDKALSGKLGEDAKNKAYKATLGTFGMRSSFSELPDVQKFVQEQTRAETDKIKAQLEYIKNQKEQIDNEEKLALIRNQPNLVEQTKDNQRKNLLKEQKDLLFQIYSERAKAQGLLESEKNKSSSITVSSLREIGGGLAGESASIANQRLNNENSPLITALEAQINGLNDMKLKTERQIEALNKNTSAIEAAKIYGNSGNSSFIQSGVNTRTADGN